MTKMKSLADRLSEIRQAFEDGSTPDHVVETLNLHIDRLVENAVHDQALKLGQIAPLEIPVFTEEGASTLAELKGKGSDFLVLTWFRGNW